MNFLDNSNDDAKNNESNGEENNNILNESNLNESRKKISNPKRVVLPRKNKFTSSYSIKKNTNENDNNDTPSNNIAENSNLAETNMPKKKYVKRVYTKRVPYKRGLISEGNSSENINKKNISENIISQKENIFPTKAANYNFNYSSIKNKILNKKSPIRISFLGGLNQIGKNITVFEYENDIIIVDCGMAFPDGEMLGVDLVIPDFTHLIKNVDKIKGLVVTHGHEDHIGAIPYLLKKINIPIYGAPLTIGLISAKLKEHKLLGVAKLNPIEIGSIITLGEFSVEFIRINHSIPDAAALAIRTTAGVIVHTGDFKIDLTPSRGEPIDIARFAQIGNEGVLALMADSTNAEKTGYTTTEKGVYKSLLRLFRQAENKRIIVATFASNIGRVQQIIDCAVLSNRKVAFSGRSMINNVGIAIELGYITAPEGLIINIEEIGSFEYCELVIITTGSQGEPMSALYRMAFSDHRKIVIGYNDFIIISANPIPGNEKMVNSIVNEMMKLGCEVIYESMYEVHVSGHACQEELKMIQALVKPKYFIPVHGECKNLKRHADLAVSMGIEEDNIYIGETGDVIEINEEKILKIGTIPNEMIMVDGIGVGDVGSIVLKDRKHLGQDGLIVMVATISFKDNKIIAGPDIVSRGFVYVKESEVLINEARRTALKGITQCLLQPNCDWSMIKTRVRDDLYKFFHDKTKRNPVILPIIMATRKNP